MPWKNIYTIPNQKKHYSGMYNNAECQITTVHFFIRAYKNNKKYDLAVGISRQNICAAQYHQKEFLLVGTDIIFVVKNIIICPYGALIYVA